MTKEVSRLTNLIRKFRHHYSLYIVRKLWVHWFNPFYTLYFNLIFLPLKQAICFPVFIYGWPRLYAQMGHIKCIDESYPGMVRINLSFPGGPQCSAGNTELTTWGTIIFHGKCVVGSGNKIIIGGVLEMGKYTRIMNFVNITAYSNVQIGDYSWVVHRSQILDTNYHFIADFKHGIVKKIAEPVKIGRYCWICNTTTVCGGSVIPDKTIVASNSLVNKDFSDLHEESVIGGIPARPINVGYRRIDSCKFEKQLYQFFTENPNADYYKMACDVEHSICDMD